MKRRPPRRANTPPPEPNRHVVVAPTGMAMRWLIAGTPVTEPYPCRCDERKFSKCSPQYCPCAGRVDALGEMPASCCALLATQRNKP
jgi:hypothetical protein